MHSDFTRDGKVLGVAVLDVQDLPGEDSAIVLLAYMTMMGEGPQRNLVKVRNGGSVTWIADLPDTDHQECHVSMDLAPAGIVFANTWLGHRVSIDSETGQNPREGIHQVALFGLWRCYDKSPRPKWDEDFCQDRFLAAKVEPAH